MSRLTRIVFATMAFVIGCAGPSDERPVAPTPTRVGPVASTAMDAVVPVDADRSPQTPPTDAVAIPACPRRFDDPNLRPESELTVAWRGEQIAVCHESPDINRCWDIDPTSASVVSTRTSAPDWLAATYYIIGLHPDGKRAAVVDTAHGIGVVDLATRQVRFFPAEDPDAKRPAGAPGGDPARIYFVGESIFLVSQVADAHSDLTAYSQAGKLLWRERLEVYNGTVSITDPQTLAINQHGLRNLILHDVASGTRKTIRRRVPKGPCDPGSLRAMGDDGSQRCSDYVDRYFAPFRGVHVLRSKQRFIGYDAFTRELVEIDGRLNPGKRVPVRCLTNP